MAFGFAAGASGTQQRFGETSEAAAGGGVEALFGAGPYG